MFDALVPRCSFLSTSSKLCLLTLFIEDTEVSLISFYSVIYLLDFEVFKNSNNDPPPTAPVEEIYGCYEIYSVG